MTNLFPDDSRTYRTCCPLEFLYLPDYTRVNRSVSIRARERMREWRLSWRKWRNVKMVVFCDKIVIYILYFYHCLSRGEKKAGDGFSITVRPFTLQFPSSHLPAPHHTAHTCLPELAHSSFPFFQPFLKAMLGCNASACACSYSKSGALVGYQFLYHICYSFVF